MTLQVYQYLKSNDRELFLENNNNGVDLNLSFDSAYNTTSDSVTLSIPDHIPR